ncbi:hypothetical protein AA313_de0203587 [Arthrobotrys entomopaga]|nr:hypothetical protein AA313_de0203587 [Arthrobotrys entomopaga]
MGYNRAQTNHITSTFLLPTTTPTRAVEPQQSRLIVIDFSPTIRASDSSRCHNEMPCKTTHLVSILGYFDFCYEDRTISGTRISKICDRLYSILDTKSEDQRLEEEWPGRASNAQASGTTAPLIKRIHDRNKHDILPVPSSNHPSPF